MRNLAKPFPAKRRRAKGAVPAPAEEVSRQAKENLCLDNDLGAEWTGNIECEEGAKRRSGTRRDK